MIKVITNKENFQYDIHSLTKAFYPEHDVKVVGMENEEELTDVSYSMKMLFEEEKITVSILSEDGEKIFHRDMPKQEDAHLYKNEMKLALYEFLCEYTGKKLPWGNLTGIRPTKLPMGMLEADMSDEEIIHALQREHAVSDEKANLALDIAKRE